MHIHASLVLSQAPILYTEASWTNQEVCKLLYSTKGLHIHRQNRRGPHPPSTEYTFEI